MTTALNILLVTKKVKLINQYVLSYLKYTKYSENGGKNMSFMVKDQDFLDKYKIMDKIEEGLSINFVANLFMIKHK